MKSETNGHVNGTSKKPYFKWSDIEKHTHADDKWLVIENSVYDITRFSKRHPGGARVISSYAGQDATDVWTGFHNDKDYVRKFLKSIHIGYVEDPKENEIETDFRELRKTVEGTGLMKTNPWFYIGHLLSIVLLEVAAYLIGCQYGVESWLTYLCIVMLLVTAQAQAGWTQHDYGHLSVFNNSKLNHLGHYFTVGHIKGVSSRWWNFRHFLHHAKTNVIVKDPDISLPYVFILGKKLPAQWARLGKGIMPYQLQHHYFFLLGPPALLPVYFHYENLYFVFKRKLWMDLAWMLSFFVRLFYTWGPLLGGLGTFKLYMFVRFIESHWFVWVTQMSHISMDVDKDIQDDWVTQQLKTTCNVESGVFNDWFCGHLNYQIEHHLFPTMPRHNFHKVMPLVKSLCKKHNIEYTCKPLLSAWADIVRALKKSGAIWYEAYNNPG